MRRGTNDRKNCDPPPPMIVAARMANQFLTRASTRDATAIVRWFGAVQAQEYGPARWALGLRARNGTTDADVQRALDDGRIVRTHVMRPTWHFVAAEDCRWLLELTAPHVHKRMAPYDRRLGLDAAVKRRGTKLLERLLRDGRHLTRRELGDGLARAGMALDPMRLAHLLLYAELERAVCSGPRRETQSTYALFDERVRAAPRLSRDEGLAELARRFLRSHGPATVRDFVWWSGLLTPSSQRAFDIVRARRIEVDGLTYWTIGAPPPSRSRAAGVHLLPIYDEYLVAYRDRVAVPHLSSSMMSFRARAPMAFQHALMIDGQVAGTWRATPRARATSVEVAPARRLTAAERRAVENVASKYGRFVGTTATDVRFERLAAASAMRR